MILRTPFVDGPLFSFFLWLDHFDREVSSLQEASTRRARSLRDLVFQAVRDERAADRAIWAENKEYKYH